MNCYGIVGHTREINGADSDGNPYLDLVPGIFWKNFTTVLLSMVKAIGGGSYWAGRAAAAHFLAFVGRSYAWPAHF